MRRLGTILLIMLLLLISLVNAQLIPKEKPEAPPTFSKIISLDPCEGEVRAWETTNVLYLESNCFHIDFDRDYNKNGQFYDKINDDYFDLKLYSLQDVNTANENQKRTDTFASMNMKGKIEGDKVTYTSADGKVKLIYRIEGAQLHADMEIKDWQSQYDNGRLEMRTRIHKSETMQGTFLSKEPVVDGKIKTLDTKVEVNGQNQFITDTLFTGKSFKDLKIDPIYQVDYSPFPATWLVGGDTATDDDGDFDNSYDITANMSDNNTATFVDIAPEIMPINVNYANIETTASTALLNYQTRISESLVVDSDGYYLIGASAVLSGATNNDAIAVITCIDTDCFNEAKYKFHDTDDRLNYMAHDIAYLPTGTYNVSLRYSSIDGDTITIRQARIIAERLNTNYKHAHSNIEQTTSSTSYVTMLNYNFNIASEDAGIYLGFANYQFTGQNPEQQMSVRWQVDGSTIARQFTENTDNSRLQDYPSHASIVMLNLSAGAHTATFDAKHESGTGYIKSQQMTFIPFSAFPYGYAESNANSATTLATFQDKVTLSYTPVLSANHIIIASLDLNNSIDNQNVLWQLTQNGTIICEGSFESEQEGADKPKNQLGMGCFVRSALLTKNYEFKLQYRNEVGGNTASAENARIVVFPAFVAGSDEKAIASKFTQTYNSNYDYYLRVNKQTTGSQKMTIYAYDDSDTPSAQLTTDTLVGTGYFNINVNSLVQYMTSNVSLGYSAFRFSADEAIDIAEVQLRLEANDSIMPTISGCAIDINATCTQTTTFYCDNITDDSDVDYVIFNINGFNRTATKNGNNYSYVCSECLDVDGVVVQNWTYVHAYDLVGNLATETSLPTGLYNCSYDEYIDIQHTSTEGLDIFVLGTSAIITWTTTNPADSLVKYGLSPANLSEQAYAVTDTTNHIIGLYGLITNTTYYYRVNSTFNPTMEIGTFNFTTFTTCVENWVKISTCLFNDTELVEYTDMNSCGTYDDLPGDNGTYVGCNYCTEDIELSLGTCLWNGTGYYQEVTYTDNNYYSCCALTGIVSDCSILYAPYNETGFQMCNELDSDFALEIDDIVYFGFNVEGEEKVYGKVWINGTNEYTCLSYVKTPGGKLIQANPVYEQQSVNTMSLFSRRYEDREYFQTSNGLANVYWTKENLVIDGSTYVFGVECANTNTSDHKISEKAVTVLYEGINAPVTRFVWLKENVFGLFLGFLILVVVVWLIAWIIYRVNRG